ncbi:thioredoxin domain-containing protein [Candidatus Gottesmanbacteria bacterium]|nr:thioredoxin domain-containing protein [Candidatus Gottesmanbacteria bacterium]
MRLTGESKLFLGVTGASILLIAIAAIFFSRPAPVQPTLPKSELLGQQPHGKGNASASTYLVEFSDFQCPACKAAKPFVDEVVEKNRERLFFVYRHFPLAQHPFGLKAAIVAEAAGVQGKFWEMYDLLFTNQENLSEALFVDLAKQLNLNEKDFTDSLSDPKTKANVSLDRDYGLKIGVNSTPTFYLNGKKLILTSYSDIRVEVERALK